MRCTTSTTLRTPGHSNRNAHPPQTIHTYGRIYSARATHGGTSKYTRASTSPSTHSTTKHSAQPCLLKRGTSPSRRRSSASSSTPTKVRFPPSPSPPALCLRFVVCDADPEGEDITVDGTIRFCQDLAVDPEDVVLLAVAFELKSPRMGEWERKGWVDGWKALGCVSPSLAPLPSFLTFVHSRAGATASPRCRRP